METEQTTEHKHKESRLRDEKSLWVSLFMIIAGSIIAASSSPSSELQTLGIVMIIFSSIFIVLAIGNYAAKRVRVEDRSFAFKTGPFR